MDPDNNRFVELMEKTTEAAETSALDEFLAHAERQLYRPDGSPVPAHWSVFKIGEQVVINNYTFKVAYIGETAILFEPVGPVVVGGATEKK